MHQNNILNKCLNKYSVRLAAYYLILAIYTIVAFIIPLKISVFIDEVVYYNSIWSRQLYILFSLSLIELFLSLLKDDLNIQLSNKIAFHIEYEIANKIKHAVYKQVEKYDDAYLAQRINNDSVIVGDFVSEKFPYFIADISLVGIILLYLYRVELVLGILFTVWIIIFFISYIVTKKWLFQYAEKMFDSQADFFAMLSDQFNSILLTKMNAWYEEKNMEFKETVHEFYKKSLKYLRLEFLIKDSGVFLSRALMIFAVCVLGWKILHGESSVGSITSIILYAEIIAAKLNTAGTYGDSYQKYKLAGKRLVELSEYPLEVNGEMQLDNISSVEMKGVSYNIENSVIQYPDIIMQKGHIYVIKGENGSGKSTMINLLLGIIQCDQGSIYYNKKLISNVDMDYLKRTVIAVKNQIPYILNGDIKRNISPDGTLHDSLSLEPVIRKMLSFTEKRGLLDMKIKHKNTELSGGEQQRIAICRSLYKKADFLILDEPTNGLDKETTNDLIVNLKSSTEKIILIITHENCFDEIADQIIYL